MSDGRPPRALFVVYSHYASDPRPRRMAEALVEAGWEVEVFSLGQAGEPARQEVNGVRVLALPVARRYRGSSVAAYLWAYIRFTAWATWQALRRWNRFDFVHVHTPPDFLAVASLPGRWRGAGTLLDVHDITPELFQERFGDRRRWVVSWAVRLERWSTRRVDRVMTVNEQVRRRLVARGVEPDRISVTMNVPEERIFWRDTPPEPPAHPVLAYHGTLVPHFGPGVLLEAAALLVPDYPDLQVRILGDGDMKAELVERAARPDLAGRVWISPERVPVHRIPKELGAVTAGVVANRSEGFPTLVLPTKLLEYLALGIPAVVTGTETIRHYFRPDELVTVEHPDPRLLADALRPILDDPAAARAQVVRARRFFERHSWREERRAYLALAGRLAASRRKDSA